MDEPKYKRVVLKLSGEALAGENKTGISPEVLDDITNQVKELKDLISLIFYYLPHIV